MSNTFKQTTTQRMARWIYTLLIALLIPLIALHTLVKTIMRAEGYGRKKLERFGILSQRVVPTNHWIHCVSVGEVVAAAILIEKLLAKQPDLKITVTTTTYTGYQRVVQLFGQRVQHCYLPYDFAPFITHFLKKIKPTSILVTEVELWPNLVHQSWRKGIPTIVINARMTDRSLNSYRKINALFEPMLHKLHHVCAQGKRDFDNYLKLGMPPCNLTLTNNMKFDIQGEAANIIRSELQEEYQLTGKPVFLAGSTHDPEEGMILDAFEHVLKVYPNLVLLLVPRHPQRFEDVYQLCTKRRLNLCRASETITHDANIILIDKMGVLSKLYQVADFAFIGGSIAQRGGHNALEAAAYSVPTMMGSSRHNNPEICQTLATSGALLEVNTTHDLKQIVLEMLSDPAQATKAGIAGRKVIDNNSGAVDTTLEIVGTIGA